MKEIKTNFLLFVGIQRFLNYKTSIALCLFMYSCCTVAYDISVQFQQKSFVVSSDIEVDDLHRLASQEFAIPTDEQDFVTQSGKIISYQKGKLGSFVRRLESIELKQVLADVRVVTVKNRENQTLEFYANRMTSLADLQKRVELAFRIPFALQKICVQGSHRLLHSDIPLLQQIGHNDVMYVDKIA